MKSGKANADNDVHKAVDESKNAASFYSKKITFDGNKLKVNTGAVRSENPIDSAFEACKSVRQDTENETNDWTLALLSNLDPEGQRLLESVSYHAAGEALSENPEYLDAAIDVLLSVDESDQRTFLLNAISVANENTQKQVKQVLLSSNRSVDRQDGISLVMNTASSDEKLKTAQLLLTSETNNQLISHVLYHLNKEENRGWVSKMKPQLWEMATYGEHTPTRVQALDAIIHSDPDSSEVTNYAFSLLNQPTDKSHQVALNALYQQINNYDVTLPEQQKQALSEQLSWILSDSNASYQSRLRSLSLLEALKRGY